MLLELRRPSLIIAGNWNPAIFTPPWIGRYAFDGSVGDEIPLAIVQETERQDLGDQVLELSQRPVVVYHEEIGISCSPNRLEIFFNRTDSTVLSRAEEICVRLLTALEHTPLGPYGVNFQFIDTDPDPAVTDLIETHEELARVKQVLSRELRTCLSFSDGCDLNLRRVLDDFGLQLAFNFHHSPSPLGTQGLNAQIPGIILKRYEELQEHFGELYDLESLQSIGVLRHELSMNQSIENDE